MTNNPRRDFLKWLATSSVFVGGASCAIDPMEKEPMPVKPGPGPTPTSPAAAALPASTDKVLFLGTQGGPSPALTRAESAAALLFGDQIYMIDCGYGAMRALNQAGVNYLQIGHIFLTHLHNDHCSDVAALLGHQWTRSRRDPTVVHGPFGTDQLVEGAILFNSGDARIRTADEGRPVPPSDLFSAQVITASTTPTVVYEDAIIKVQAVENTHYTETFKAASEDRSLAYRIDSASRSVVFSGDTAYSEALIELARDVDIFICEAIDVPATRISFDKQVAMGAFGDNPEGIWNHIVETHTPLDQVGMMATMANAKTLVINHLVPGGLDPTQLDQAYIDQITPTYAGPIVVAADQMML
jgi:ribonuclease BN (tRNA processing enzyme)